MPVSMPIMKIASPLWGPQRPHLGRPQAGVANEAGGVKEVVKPLPPNDFSQGKLGKIDLSLSLMHICIYIYMYIYVCIIIDGI